MTADAKVDSHHGVQMQKLLPIRVRTSDVNLLRASKSAHQHPIEQLASTAYIL
jgi:hypothetical protein